MAASWMGVLLIGLLAGLLARLISSDPARPAGLPADDLPRPSPAPCCSPGSAKPTGMDAEGDHAGFVGAVIGALPVLGLWRMVAGNR